MGAVSVAEQAECVYEDFGFEAAPTDPMNLQLRGFTSGSPSAVDPRVTEPDRDVHREPCG